MAGNVVPSADDVFEASILPPQEGGAVKPSTVLGSVAGIAGPIAAVSPVLAPIAAPIAAIAGIGSAIAKLFGGGLDVPGSGFTQKELMMLGHIKMRHDARVAAAKSSPDA